MHGRKSLHNREQTIKSNSSEGSEEKRRVVEKKSLNLPREYLSGREQNVHENMNIKGHTDEVSDGNEEHVNWKLDEMPSTLQSSKQRMQLNCSYPSILWKSECVSDEFGYLAETFSKQSVEGAAWLLLNAYTKMGEEMT